MLIVYVQNLTGKAVSDYAVRVCVNTREIATLMIEGHRRADGWPTLLRKIADAAAPPVP